MDPMMIAEWAGVAGAHLSELVQAQDFNVKPVPPPGLEGPINKLLSYAKWLSYAVTVLGIMIAGAGAVISRQEGSSEEGTQTAIRIGIGAAVIGASGSILSMFTTGAPSSPWGMEGTGILELLNQWLGWLLWAGLAASVAAMILFAALFIIDRERGQAISATAPHVEALGWAVGVAVMCAAGQIARSLLT